MSDFYTHVRLLRTDVAEMLCDNDEHAMWVLAYVAARVDASDLHENIDGIDEDPREVAQFLRDMADMIDAGLEATP